MWRLFYSGHFCGKGLGYIGNTPALGAGSFQLRSALAWEKYSWAEGWEGSLWWPWAAGSLTDGSCSCQYFLHYLEYATYLLFWEMIGCPKFTWTNKLLPEQKLAIPDLSNQGWRTKITWREFQLAAKPAAMFLLGRSTACLQLSLSILRDDKGGKILSYHYSHISLHLLNLSNGEWCQILFPQLFVSSQSNYLGYFFPY